jgi:molecular chaperone HtpG
MAHICESQVLSPKVRSELRKALAKIKRQTEKLHGQESKKTALDKLPTHKQRTYREVFDLIYECSTNRVAAKSLVDKILARIELLGR